eukprot:scaffold118899_cov63-Phaeocystis_antarctica.AAC.2
MPRLTPKEKVRRVARLDGIESRHDLGDVREDQRERAGAEHLHGHREHELGVGDGDGRRAVAEGAHRRERPIHGAQVDPADFIRRALPARVGQHGQALPVRPVKVLGDPRALAVAAQHPAEGEEGAAAPMRDEEPDEHDDAEAEQLAARALPEAVQHAAQPQHPHRLDQREEGERRASLGGQSLRAQTRRLWPRLVPGPQPPLGAERHGRSSRVW